MQLFALNSEKKLIFANHAFKKNDYCCIECGQTVRLRGGPHRQTHYYHVNPSISCRQNGKSMEHLQTQLYLFHLLPNSDVELEKRFDSINRVADVVWLSKKLIFEIQCSPITAEEAQARNKDYAACGFQVIWIFHDKRFNQWRLSAVEQTLQNSPYYFTNIDADGRGSIYDQFDIADKGVRKNKLRSLTIAAHSPRLMHDKKFAMPLPKKIQQRVKAWPIFFEGDLVDLCILPDPSPAMLEYLEKIFAAERGHVDMADDVVIGRKAKIHKVLWHCLIRPYRLMFQIFLERACK